MPEKNATALFQLGLVLVAFSIRTTYAVHRVTQRLMLARERKALGARRRDRGETRCSRPPTLSHFRAAPPFLRSSRCPLGRIFHLRRRIARRILREGSDECEGIARSCCGQIGRAHV